MNVLLKITILSALLLTLLPGCYRAEIRTIEIKVQGVQSEDCFAAIEKSIKGTLLAPKEVVGPTSRIRSIDWDEKNEVVKVTFNGMAMAIKNVEYAIAEAGFPANDVAARGAPPEGCGVQAKPAP